MTNEIAALTKHYSYANISPITAKDRQGVEKFWLNSLLPFCYRTTLYFILVSYVQIYTNRYRYILSIYPKFDWLIHEENNKLKCIFRFSGVRYNFNTNSPCLVTLFLKITDNSSYIVIYYTIALACRDI